MLVVLQGGIANAATITLEVTVDGKAEPWDSSLNPGFAFGIEDGTAPEVVDSSSGISFAPGSAITISYVSGLVSAFGGTPIVDGDGHVGLVFKNDVLGSTGEPFPSFYTPADWDTFLMALMATFTDSSGVIVGTPFEVGAGTVTKVAPAGATQLQLGLNDDLFADNTGAFVVHVSGEMVPEPSSLIALLGLGLTAGACHLRSRNRRRRTGK